MQAFACEMYIGLENKIVRRKKLIFCANKKVETNYRKLFAGKSQFKGKN
jgi:hypothetical protein